MFLKLNIKTDKTTKKSYKYYRLCESYRLGDKTRHRTIIDIGKLEQIDNALERKQLADAIDLILNGMVPLFEIDPAIKTIALDIVAKIRHNQSKAIYTNSATTATTLSTPQAIPAPSFETIDTNTIEHEWVKEIGAESLCKQAIDQLELVSFLQQKGWTPDQINKALIHLISRAVYPASEHKTAQWIQQNSAVAALYNVDYDKITRHHLYAAAKNLYAIHDDIETYLSTKTSSLFDLDDKIILYDLTNTYFEGTKKGSNLAQFGRSKEKRSDCKLVVLALVINEDGFVKHSKLFNGNTADSTTLIAIIEQLQHSTYLNADVKPIVVIDAGIATLENLKAIKEKGYDYLCVSRTKLKEYTLKQGAKTTLYDNRNNPIEVKLIEKQQSDDDQYLYVHSTKKEWKEEAMKVRMDKHLEDQLNYLKQGLTIKGRTKKTDKVLEKIGRLKQQYASSAQYFSIAIVKDNNGNTTDITWNANEKTKPESGVYFLRTSLQNIDEAAMWRIYNCLCEIEASFRTLKTDLHLRPVFHIIDKNTEAHLFLGVLAYSLVATIRYQLKQKGITHDWSNIVRIMNTQKLVKTTMKTKENTTICIIKASQPNAQVFEICNALNYNTSPIKRKKYVLPEKQ